MPRERESRVFRVSLELGDDELDAYQAIVDRIASTSLSPRANSGLIAMGCVAAFLCAGLMFLTGAVGQAGGAAIAALAFGAYWLGAWAPFIWAALAGSNASAERDKTRRGLRGTTLILGSRRLAMVSEGWRSTLERRAVHAITTEGALTLIWLSPETNTYPFAAVATRRLTPTQRAELAAFPLPRPRG